MAIHPARRIWTTLEPIHDVVYFGAGVKEAGVAVGLRGYWQTYFAFRAAPLGPVGPGAVTAVFAGFHPEMVGKALPDAWSRASVSDCLAARSALATGLLRSAGAADPVAARAVDLLLPALRRADPTGRPLFAANADLPLGDDPVAALWQVATALREHRGDGHVAALVAAGVSGPRALVLQVAAGKVTEPVLRNARGWSVPEWAALVEESRAAGLLTGDPHAPILTGQGADLLTSVESVTDVAAWGGALSALTPEAVEEVVVSLAPLVEAVRGSIVPPDNPVGAGR
ncbi:SCO6745 family protein [Nocardia takedensis]